MAFDTVIDKAQLEAAMKATADAIREKTGDTANCTWDPAQGFAALIAAIEAGGGSGGADLGPFTQIVTGTITPSSDTQYFEIPNVVTEFIVAFAIGYVGTDRIAKTSGYLLSGGYTVFTVYNIDANSIDLMSPIKIMRVASTSNSKSNNYPDISGNTFNLGSSYKLKAGHEYGYVICTRKNPSEHATMTGGSI